LTDNFSLFFFSFAFLFQFTLSVLVSTVPGSAGVRLEDEHLLEEQQDKPVLLDAVSHEEQSQSSAPLN
jgi:hypothetical protein